MKKTVRFLSMVLVFVMVATMLTSCGSKYPALEKAFMEKDYEVNATFTSVADSIKAELEKEEYAVELHMLTKTSGVIPPSVLIIEFKTTQEMVEAYNESATIQGLVQDISENEDVNEVYSALEKAGYACGNCLCVPLAILSINEITNIVKSVSGK
ncbi:MAG: hypothetical protein ACI3XF_06810 [Eubacteriales bacterium]